MKTNQRASVSIVAGLAILLVSPAIAQKDLTAKSGSFEAAWIASGTVHVLDFVDSSSAASGRLTGTVTIQSSVGFLRNFETDCVVFADTRTGAVGRCVWKDPLGDLIYLETQGSGAGGFGATRGVFIGGTGKYRGIQGGVQYEWSVNVHGGGDTTLDGQSVQMRGNYRMGD